MQEVEILVGLSIENIFDFSIQV